MSDNLSVWRFVSIALAGLALLLASCSEVAPVQDSGPLPEASSEPDVPEDIEPEPVVVPKPEPKRSEPVAPTRPLSALEKQAALYGAEANRGEDGRSISISNSEDTLLVAENRRKALLNGKVVFLSETLERGRGKIGFGEIDEAAVLSAIFDPQSYVPENDLIVIDPGHGGVENGAKNDTISLYEKEICLDVAERLQTRLTELGHAVLLTRYDDRQLPLEERSMIANRANAAVFISIHFNASLNTEAKGLETYILTPTGAISTGESTLSNDAIAWPGNAFDALNFRLGFIVHDALTSSLERIDRGLKRARFKVLKDLEMPGVLVECGFVSHPDEAMLVSTPAYREKTATALATALHTFIERSSKDGERDNSPVTE